MNRTLESYFRELDRERAAFRSYDPERKRRFHRAATLFLRALKRRRVLSIEAEIRSNPAGDAVSGEVTASDPCYGVYVRLGADGECSFLVRGCDHSDPYGAGMRFRNMFARNAREGYDLIQNLTSAQRARIEGTSTGGR